MSSNRKKNGTSFGRKLVLEFKTAFDEEPKEISEYLNGIAKDTMLKAGAHILSIKKHGSEFSETKAFLGMFFRQENQTFANEVYGKILNLEKEHNTKIIIPLAQSSLQLFEYAFEHLSDEETQDAAESEVNIFKAYLLLNQRNMEKDDVALETTKDLPPAKKYPSLVLAQTLVYFDIEHYNEAELFTCQLIKAVYLFQFLSSTEQTSVLLQSFLADVSCDNWKEYLKRLFQYTAQ